MRRQFDNSPENSEATRPRLVSDDEERGSADAPCPFQESVPDRDLPTQIGIVDREQEQTLEVEHPERHFPSSSQQGTNSRESLSFSRQEGVTMQNGPATSSVHSLPLANPHAEQQPSDAIRENVEVHVHIDIILRQEGRVGEDRGRQDGEVGERHNGEHVQHQDGSIDDNPAARGPQNGYRRLLRRNGARDRREDAHELERRIVNLALRAEMRRPHSERNAPAG